MLNHTRQRGMATLAMSLIFLFLMSLVMFRTSSVELFEIKTGNNQYFQAKALESARGGIEYGLAWLTTSNNTSLLSWVSDNTGPSGSNQRASSATFPASVSSQVIGGYTAAVSLWRNSTNPATLELRSISTGDATATVRQKITLSTASSSAAATLDLTRVAAIVVNGGMSGITGNPSIIAGTSGTAITTSQSLASIETGHLSVTGNIAVNAFVGTAWNAVFPNTTQAQMQAASDAQVAANTTPRTIYYYNAANLPPSPWHTNIGTSSTPGILVFDTGAGCPKMNGSVIIYGIVYYADSCASNGWGGATIYGSMVAEQSITNLNANATFDGWGAITGGSGIINLPPITTTVNTFAKRIGSWRDF